MTRIDSDSYPLSRARSGADGLCVSLRCLCVYARCLWPVWLSCTGLKASISQMPYFVAGGSSRTLPVLCAGALMFGSMAGAGDREGKAGLSWREFAHRILSCCEFQRLQYCSPAHAWLRFRHSP
jgi:hypothetical protein